MPTQPIGLNDFTRQWALTRFDVHDAVERVGASGWYVLGDEVEAFERELAVKCGAEYAVGCASGLDALELALRASGLKPGDRVITTPLSAFATTLAILRAGGKPFFVDVDELGLIDLTLVEQVLREGGGRFRFLLPVHLYGCPLDLQRLRRLAEEYSVDIVEDCAQAIGASAGGSAVGSIGRAGGMSFYPTKNLGCMGDGGAVLSRDNEVAQRVRALRDYGQTAKYQHDQLGLNSRLDELHAAVLRSAMMPRLTEWTCRRKAIASMYVRAFERTELQVLHLPDERESVWHLFPVFSRDSTERNSLLEHLRSRNIITGIHYPSLIPDQRAMSAVEGWSVLTPLDRARRLTATVVSLPIHPFLTDEEVCVVIDTCLEWIGRL